MVIENGSAEFNICFLSSALNFPPSSTIFKINNFLVFAFISVKMWLVQVSYLIYLSQKWLRICLQFRIKHIIKILCWWQNEKLKSEDGKQISWKEEPVSSIKSVNLLLLTLNTFASFHIVYHIIWYTLTTQGSISTQMMYPPLSRPSQTPWVPHSSPTLGSHTRVPHSGPILGSHTQVPHSGYAIGSQSGPL